MEVCRRSSWLLLLLGVSLLATTLQGVQGEAESEGPSESECRPYIEKALKELETGESGTIGTPETGDNKEDVPTVEITTDDSDHQEGEGDDDTHEEGTESVEVDQNVTDEKQGDNREGRSTEETETEQSEETDTTQEETDEPETKVGTSGETDDQDEDTAKAEETGDVAESEEAHASIEENEAAEDTKEELDDTKEYIDDIKEENDDTNEETDNIEIKSDDIKEEDDDTKEETDDTKEETDDTKEEADDTKEQGDDTKEDADDTKEDADDTKEDTDDTKEDVESVEAEEQVIKQEEVDRQETQEEANETTESIEGEDQQGETVEDEASQEAQQEDDSTETQEEQDETGENTKSALTESDKSEVTENDKSNTQEEETDEEQRGSMESNTIEEQGASTETDTVEEQGGSAETETAEDQRSSTETETAEDQKVSTDGETLEEQGSSAETETVEEQGGSAESEAPGDTDERSAEKDNSTPDNARQEESSEEVHEEVKEESIESAPEGTENVEEGETQSTEGDEESKGEEGDSAPEEELSLDVEIPSDLRDRSHVEQLLKIDEGASETQKIINRVAEITLRELKKLYENAIKPLEVLYKYRDLSNRHFGDAEIFSKPLILFMGPWSGGKSSIINYLLDNEYNETSLRTGAEPSPAYFNILMYGEEPEIWDGTQLAADFTFSGLQKFGQGLEERLRGVRLPSQLLAKVNIVEIPGILEVRKQVSRVFPFNDACQWFIDRADIIFLVYDPSKLDVGPETEAILDQLKGREHQTRIILNKADQVKPEELMRVQGALIWNISPLMSSAQPPVMYTTSLWSRPYESWAPVRLLQAQERAFLRDLRSAVDKRIENKIASARRFAVRVRNHAKMVDCYLTTYYNHKSVFGNRKQVAEAIIEHPQDYHIYEGLSTLTNISRYDLPDPDVYRDFFKLNQLYDFQQLSATCTYFRGCPINRLDVAIAYDLPELIGKHKRLVESALGEANPTPTPDS